MLTPTPPYSSQRSRFGDCSLDCIATINEHFALHLPIYVALSPHCISMFVVVVQEQQNNGGRSRTLRNRNLRPLEPFILVDWLAPSNPGSGNLQFHKDSGRPVTSVYWTLPNGPGMCSHLS